MIARSSEGDTLSIGNTAVARHESGHSKCILATSDLAKVGQVRGQSKPISINPTLHNVRDVYAV